MSASAQDMNDSDEYEDQEGRYDEPFSSDSLDTQIGKNKTVSFS